MKGFLSEQLKPSHVPFPIASHIWLSSAVVTCERLNVSDFPFDQVVTLFCRLCRPNQPTSPPGQYNLYKNIRSSLSCAVTNDLFSALHAFNEVLKFASVVSISLKIRRWFPNAQSRSPIEMKTEHSHFFHLPDLYSLENHKHYKV